VRWDELFSDLETDARGLDQREQDLEIAERTRMELARVDLLARLAAAVGLDLELRLDVLGPLGGRLERVTARWLLLGAGAAQWVVALDAVLGVRGLPVRALAAGRNAVAARLGWGSAWRVLARDRTPVHVVRRDGSTLDGVADRVGEDFVELSVAMRAAGQRELVPFAAVVAARLSADPP
jgi:hypothetical protein